MSTFKTLGKKAFENILGKGNQQHAEVCASVFGLGQFDHNKQICYKNPPKTFLLTGGPKMFIKRWTALNCHLSLKVNVPLEY